MPLDIDTPFRRTARTHKSPNTAECDPAIWRGAVEGGGLTDLDLNLCAMAIWLAQQSKTLRDYYQANPLPKLSAKLSTLLAVAMLNRECFVFDLKHQKAQRQALKAGALAADHLTHIGVKRSDGLFEVDAPSFVDAAVDAVDSWLYEVTDSKEPAPQQADLGNTAVRYVKRFSAQRGHYDLWQRALWEGYVLKSIGEEGGPPQFAFGPSDPTLTALLDGCNHRNESNIMGYAWIDISAWPQMTPERRRDVQLPLTVLACTKDTGKARRFVVGRPKSDAAQVPAYVIGRSSLDVSYLSLFLDRLFPADADLNCDLLLRAWFVILDMAEVLASDRSEATFNDIANVRSWALVVKRSEVVDVVRRALEVGADQAAKIVQFLCWRKGNYKGLWGAPLVPLPESDDIALAHNVLRTSNTVRRAEIWLTNGGLDDQLSSGSKGTSFEAEFRARVRHSLSRNAIVKDSACAEHATKKTKSFPEQIDLLIQFGSLLLVGEVKCFVYPADSREHYNHLRKLKDAATQARRKAAAVVAHLDAAASALGISLEKAQSLTVVPIVVVNQGFGMSLTFEDCVVTDAQFLELYLSSGNYVSEASVNRVDGGMAQSVKHLYRTEQEAVRNFAGTMRKPPSLLRFVERLRWKTMGFPTHSGVPLQVEFTELGDVSGELRSDYEMLGAMSKVTQGNLRSARSVHSRKTR